VSDRLLCLSELEKSWKVIGFKIQIFQVQNVTELGLCAGRSREINLSGC